MFFTKPTQSVGYFSIKNSFSNSWTNLSLVSKVVTTMFGAYIGI